MQPKTKLQIEVVGLSKKLPNISNAQKVWAFGHQFEHFARRTKAETACLSCGEVWPTDSKATDKHVRCQKCGKRLRVRADHKRVFSDYYYLCDLKVVGGYQVVRHYEVNRHIRMGEKPRFSIFEVAQQWIRPDWKITTLSCCLTMSGAISYGTPLEVRSQSAYSYGGNRFERICPDAVLPRWNVWPDVKRNGFNGNVHLTNPCSLFRKLLEDPIAETLIKSGQYSVLNNYVHGNLYSFHRLWPPIKICIRNKYHIDDASIYKDYIDLLEYFNKDTHNAKFACPRNLKQAHDILMRRKRKIEIERQRIRDIERKKQQAIEDKENEEKFLREKAPFFGIRFSDGVIDVVVIDSINEMMKEGDTLDHCVFTNRYFAKDDSLIMSARIEDKPVETIELLLSKLQVVQCRGKMNFDSEYHDQILTLVNSNLRKIAKVAKSVAPVAEPAQ